IGLIFMLVSNSSNYTMYVTNFFITALPGFIQSITNDSSVNGTIFDNFASYVATQGTSISENSSSFDFSSQSEGIILTVMGYSVAAIAFVFALIPQIFIALLVAVGPVFIACGLFETTRRFF